VSDGANNLGANPARASAEAAAPIYTIGVGDTTTKADAVIAELLTNEVTYAGSRVPLDVRVRARGLEGKHTVVHLIGANGTEIGRQSAAFADDLSELTTSFTFEAASVGDMRLSVVMDSVVGESIMENNRRSVIVKVLESKARVFLFGGAPSADVTILKQTLDLDTTLLVSSYVEIGAGEAVGNVSEPSADDLAKARLFVLVDFPTRTTSSGLTGRIARAASKGNVPLLLLAGPHLAPSRLSEFGEMMPVSPLKQSLSEEPMVARSAAAHPAMVGRGSLPAEWSDLPPALGGAGNFAVQATAQVAVKLSREALGIEEDEPGIVFWQTGSRRGAAVLCWSTSRWKLRLAGSSAAAAFFDELMSRMVAWLIAPAEEQRVRIRATKRLYSGGESVRFVAQVYGADLAPRDDAVMALRVTSGSRTETVPMRSRGSGRYEGEMNPWADGDYRFNGWALVGTDTLGTDRGLFAVEPFSIEMLDTRARFDVLRQVAAASHGQFVPASQADSLLAALRFAPQEVRSRIEIPLWTRGLIVWIIIVLLSLEWIIRKRSGML